VPTTQKNRAAYSPSEFAALLGKSPTFAYRLLYSGKVRAVTGFGRTLIPATELDRLLGSAQRYNPRKDEAEVEAEEAMPA
jgi:hypothetical protein